MVLMSWVCTRLFFFGKVSGEASARAPQLGTAHAAGKPGSQNGSGVLTRLGVAGPDQTLYRTAPHPRSSLQNDSRAFHQNRPRPPREPFKRPTSPRTCDC